jgi:hypothetical protein
MARVRRLVNRQPRSRNEVDEGIDEGAEPAESAEPRNLRDRLPPDLQPEFDRLVVALLEAAVSTWRHRQVTRPRPSRKLIDIPRAR